MYRKFIHTFNNFYRFTEIYRPKNREIIDFFSFTEIGKNWKLWDMTFSKKFPRVSDGSGILV